MKHSTMAAVMAAIALSAAAPAFAGPLPEGGVTYAQMSEILTKHGLPAKLDKDNKGVQIIKSTIVGVNFDVYFYNCTNDRCLEIQFAAGWTNAKATAAEINTWNRTKRRARVYSMPNNVIYAEQDAIVSRGTTENIDYCLTLWGQTIADFKKVMKL